MFRHAAANARHVLRSFTRSKPTSRIQRQQRSQSSQSRPPNKTEASSSSSASSSTRASKILDRLPRRFQKQTTSLRKAPLSHIIAFLVLHEITAVVPLVALFSLFHYTSYSPLEYLTGHYATYVRDGASKAERYFSKKGWFGFDKQDRGRITDDFEAEEHAGETHEVEQRWAKEEGVVTGSFAYTTRKATPEAAHETENVLKRWVEEDTRYKVVAEVAMAWAVTKALLPARILLSVWGTPWFAGVLVQARNALRRS